MCRSIIADIQAFGGTIEPTTSTTHCVSVWCALDENKPNDSRLIMGFFSNEKLARQFEFKYMLPPGQAFRIPYDYIAKELWKSLIQS